MLNTTPILLALLHPAAAPHLHADEPSSALWLTVSVGLIVSAAVFLLIRRVGSQNSAR